MADQQHRESDPGRDVPDGVPATDPLPGGSGGSWPDAGSPPPPDPPPAPVDPPHAAAPPAAPVGLVPEPAPEAGQPGDWQERYQQERRRSRVFLSTTAVAGALLVGSLFFAAAQGDAASPTAGVPGQGLGRGMGPGMPGDGFGRHAPGDGRDMDRGMGFGGAIESLFNPDGSLDESAVARFKQQIAGLDAAAQQALAAHIAGDVTRGHLSQQQADDLLAALDLPSTGTDNAGTT